MEETQANLLPLDAPERTVAMKLLDSGATVRHTFRALTLADIDAYFSEMKVESAREGDGLAWEIDLVTPRLKLYDRAIRSVDGYKLTDGRKLTDLPNWKNRVPGPHRLKAIERLIDVARSEGSSGVLLDPEAEIVKVDAFWSAAPGAETMAKYLGLVHRFQAPSVEHWRKLNNASSRSVAVGGSRSGRTIYPKLNRVYAELYDELILSVDGYSFGGEPLTERAQIAAQMDPFHKIAAATALFDRSAEAAADETEVME